MEHFHSDWTFKPITMLHVNAPIDLNVTVGGCRVIIINCCVLMNDLVSS